MHRFTRSERFLAAALSALAGYVDAVGYVELGQYFVSFMSGNSTRLGVGLAGYSADALNAAGLIASFVTGVATGSLIGHFAGRNRQTVVLVFVATALAVAATAGLGALPWIAGGAMAIAMGAENAVFEKEGEVRVGLTYMTGMLVKVGQRIALAMRGGPRFAWAPYLLQWSSLAAGAVAGASIHAAMGLNALWFAAVIAVALAVFAGRFTRDTAI